VFLWQQILLLHNQLCNRVAYRNIQAFHLHFHECNGNFLQSEILRCKENRILRIICIGHLLLGINFCCLLTSLMLQVAFHSVFWII
jgi:hypothetical protein